MQSVTSSVLPGCSCFALLFQLQSLLDADDYLNLYAIGGSFIKPSVLGTVGLTSTQETRSLGFAIYYWLVNISALGPLLAFLRDSFGIQFVYIVSAISCALMFVTTRFFFKEPPAKLDEKNKILKQFLQICLGTG